MKPSAKSSGRTPVPQPHGGALVPGAGGGRQPRSGRPPSAVKAACRESLGDCIEILGKIADDKTARASDRIRAIDVMAKYGLGGNGRWHIEDVIALTQELGGAVARHLRDEDAVEAIKEEWVSILQSWSR